MIYLLMMIVFNTGFSFVWAANDVQLFRKDEPVKHWKKYLYLGPLFYFMSGVLVAYQVLPTFYGMVLLSGWWWITFDLSYNWHRFGGKDPFYVGQTATVDRIFNAKFINYIAKLIWLSLGIGFYCPKIIKIWGWSTYWPF